MTGRWLRTFTDVPSPGPRLVCFPHAGGTAEFFRPLAKALAGDIEVVAVQYPGRQDRRHEPPVADLRQLARELSPVLAPLHDEGPVVYFGHSMGSVIAFEIALLGDARPDVLIASGARSPACARTERLDLDDDEAIVDEIHWLGGTARAVLDDPDLRAMFLPVIRGDYQALRAYSYAEGSVVDCPIRVMVGRSDPRVTFWQAYRWRQLTTGRFEFKTLDGGHFYLTGRETEVAAAIRAELSALV